MMARFVLRDGTVTNAKPFDYSIYQDRLEGAWCTLCEVIIPSPKNPVGAGEFDRQTSRFTHSVGYHLEKRVDE